METRHTSIPKLREWDPWVRGLVCLPNILLETLISRKFMEKW